MVNCWVMTDGTVLCVDSRFTDWYGCSEASHPCVAMAPLNCLAACRFGKGHGDIVGRSIATLGVEQDRIRECALLLLGWATIACRLYRVEQLWTGTDSRMLLVCYRT